VHVFKTHLSTTLVVQEAAANSSALRTAASFVSIAIFTRGPDLLRVSVVRADAEQNALKYHLSIQ
jgi:hypothetical protein